MVRCGLTKEVDMPVLKLSDAEIYYQEYGAGYPVLLFAPGGMRSSGYVPSGPRSNVVER